MRYFVTVILGLILSGNIYAAADFADVGFPGNPAMPIPGTRNRGQVNHLFRLSERPVSNRQYCKFLNSLPKEQAKEHFHPEMKIRHADGNYFPVTGAEDEPVTMLNFMDAAEYCNYLSGGPVYRIIDNQVTARDTAAVDAGRVFFIPSRNEWLKGRFFRSGSWMKYTPSPHAEMIEDLSRTWYRVAVGRGSSPEETVVINNYTTNSGGLSEDNIRRPDVTLRIAATPPFSVEKKLNEHHNLYTVAEPELKVVVRAEYKADLKFSWRIVDYFGKEISAGIRQMQLEPGLNTVAIPSETGVREGYFRLMPELQIDEKSWPAPEIPFVIGTRNEFSPVPDAAFGLSTHLDRMKFCWGRMLPEDYLSILKFMKVSFLRTDRPERTTSEAMLDEGIRLLTFLPFHYDYKLYKTPPETAETEKWRSLGVPEELITYALQCDRLMRSNPDITDWEIGNEPHAWRITPADYAQQAKVARIVADAGKYPVRLVLGDMNFICRSVIGEADAARFSDAVAIHAYGFFDKRYDHAIPARIEQLKRVLAERGEPDKPVWMTEISGCGYWQTIYPGTTREENLRYQALDLPKKLLGSRALGVEKVFFYQFSDMVVDGTEGQFGLVDSRLFPKPAMVVFRTVSELFEGAEFEGKFQLPDHLTGLGFLRGEQRCAVLWRNDKPKYLIRRSPGIRQPMIPIGGPELVKLDAAEPVEMFDLMGNRSVLEPRSGKIEIPVSEYPIFLRGDFETDLDCNYGQVQAEVRPLPVAKLQFLPTLPVLYGLTSLHNMQLGIRMELKRNTPQQIALRVHNLRDHAIEGEVTLLPPGNFDDDGWSVEPSSIRVKIPANGAGTVRFNVKTGLMENLTAQLYILGASFTSGKEVVYDQIMVRPVHPDGKMKIY